MSYLMRIARSKYTTLGVLGLLVASSVVWVALARQQQKKEPPTPGPMLGQGFLDLDTPSFSLRLVRSSQTVAALKPKGAGDFDFTPGDLLIERSRDGYYHLGDIDLRLRSGTSGEWQNYSTALARKPSRHSPRRNKFSPLPILPQLCPRISPCKSPERGRSKMESLPCGSHSRTRQQAAYRLALWASR